MKKITYFITAILTCGGIVLQAAVPAFAINALSGEKTITAANKLENRVQNQASIAANKQQTELQTVIQKADALITNRLDSLNEISNRIQSDTRLTASEKSSLTTDIQKKC